LITLPIQPHYSLAKSISREQRPRIIAISNWISPCKKNASIQMYDSWRAGEHEEASTGTLDWDGQKSWESKTRDYLNRFITFFCIFIFLVIVAKIIIKLSFFGTLDWDDQKSWESKTQKPFSQPTLNLILTRNSISSRGKHCKPWDLYLLKTTRKISSLWKNITIASLLISYTIPLSLYNSNSPYFQYFAH